ncbi:MAG: hypothetical protein WC942_05365 [Clostridia bacterium]|jgi:hypothetical protein
MKVYVSRDEDDDFVYVWKTPQKGNFKPEQYKESTKVNYQRTESMDELDSYDIYNVDDFKIKFGLTIKEKELSVKHLPDLLVDDEKFKLFSYNKKWKNCSQISTFKKTKKNKENIDSNGYEDIENEQSN